MNPVVKEHLISAALTFLTGFFIFFGQGLMDSAITVESLQDGTLLGLILIAVRGGLKLMVAPFVTKYLK